ncbi:hypothetical protein N802_02715 [Knoellia sinensis KCTC 19936]|uniref:Uncharacterized protein n=1 Tax=Knoellia sinensis KCTC 19936 TaxID=1385520 RepID=A0A0A0JE65_9MICO|nr:hypothetical protein [Knoellia sinensis]KGN35064.1 hypothetical protein N802_02715 [Knoellia sinensis KCTC 19936]
MYRRRLQQVRRTLHERAVHEAQRKAQLHLERERMLAEVRMIVR